MKWTNTKNQKVIISNDDTDPYFRFRIERAERLKKARASQLRKARYQRSRTADQKAAATKRAANKLMKAFGK